MVKRMTISRAVGLLAAAFACASFLPGGENGSGAEVWLTNPDKSALFEKQLMPLPLATPGDARPTIEIDETQKFQSIDGFGFALTGGSAQHLIHMNRGSPRRHSQRTVCD